MQIRALSFFLFISTYILLEISYVSFVSEIYTYSGFNKLEDGNKILNIVIYFFVLIISFFSSRLIKSHFSITTIYVVLSFLIFPSFILYKYTHSNIYIFLSYISLYFFLYIFLKYFNFKVKTKKFNFYSSKFLLVFFSLTLVIPFLISFGTSINYNNLLLIDVYESREDFYYKSNSFLNYSLSLLSKIIAPIGLLFSLKSKNVLYSIFFTLIIFYLFLLTGNKLILFGYFVICFFYFVKPEKSFLYLSIILIISMISFYFFNINEIGGLLLRRVFFLPGLLDIYYFDYFDDKHLYYSHSFLSFFSDYPYSQLPKKIIAIEYFNNFEMNANNGIISDGFINLGIPGILFNIIIFSIIITFIKSLKVNMRYYGVVFLFIFSLISSPLSTVLVTHGGLILLLLLNYFLKNTNEN